MNVFYLLIQANDSNDYQPERKYLQAAHRDLLLSEWELKLKSEHLPQSFAAFTFAFLLRESALTLAS